ncbi:MAG: aldehyde dehydrogenase family protein [Candidatus Nanopelagicales bacterium]
MNNSFAMDENKVNDLVHGARVGEAAWAQVPLQQRIVMLDQIRVDTGEIAQGWVDTAAATKGLPDTSPLVGEEWISGPWALATYVEALAATLRSLEANVNPLSHVKIHAAPGGRLALNVFPVHGMEKLLLHGFRAEVWTLPGITQADLHTSAGLAQRNPKETHGVALVLGAGNITSIAPLDVLYELFAKNRSVILKLNPVLGDLQSTLEKVFAPFIELGVVSIVTGDAALGALLVEHSGIDAIHITGSKTSYDSIVASIGRTSQPEKPISSELGGVSPVIVVPGDWSKADLRFQAEHVVTQRLHNSGSNCIASQVVLISSDWAQKTDFLNELRVAYRQAPARPNWYPGGSERTANAALDHSGCEVTEYESRVLLTGLDVADATTSSYRTEYFSPVLSVAQLPGKGADFLDAAVNFSNGRLQGTLGANIIASPKTIHEIGSRLQDAIAALRYGCVGVNCWTGLGFLVGRATWGAFPVDRGEEVVSGNGVVHNALLLDGVERTVVYGPFRPLSRSLINFEWAISPKPPWFVSNKTAASTGKHLTDLAATRNKLQLVPIFYSALRG